MLRGPMRDMRKQRHGGYPSVPLLLALAAVPSARCSSGEGTTLGGLRLSFSGRLAGVRKSGHGHGTRTGQKQAEYEYRDSR